MVAFSHAICPLFTKGARGAGMADDSIQMSMNAIAVVTNEGRIVFVVPCQIV